VEWLQTPGVELFGSSVSRLELLGALTGLASVWWAARERVWTWPVGIVNSALFLLLFVDAKLYATAALQVAFIVLGVYGWCQWSRGGPAGAELPVRRTRRWEWAALAVVAVAAQAAWTTWLVLSTDSTVPFWDAAVLVLSLVATYGQARKLLESWWIWLVVDAISVPLFLGQQLYATALLYGVFEVLCVVGLRDWQRSLRAQEAAAPVVDPRPAERT
jgi:nicotinamide mononucleotide transporter